MVNKVTDLCRPRLVSLLLVLALHAAALYGMWCEQLRPSPVTVSTLLVNLVASAEEKETPKPQPQAKPKPKPRRQPPTAPEARQPVDEAPSSAAIDYAASPSTSPSSEEPESIPFAAVLAPATTAPLPLAPVNLSTELSVACPQRAAPIYPAKSRRLGEFGVVMLRVELSETGHVALARVQSTSGFGRLDEAALSAVRNWHCSPAMRQGQPVRASALQPFRFVMQKD
jgi:periplasmic protein TonB